jgi:hypothetical protein
MASIDIDFNAAIAASSSGDNEIVAAIAGKRIAVYGYMLVAAGAVTARWESGAGGTALSGQMSFGANGGAVAPLSCDKAWMITGVGQSLNLELGGAVSVAGHVTYDYID